MSKIPRTNECHAGSSMKLGMPRPVTHWCHQCVRCCIGSGSSRSLPREECYPDDLVHTVRPRIKTKQLNQQTNWTKVVTSSIACAFSALSGAMKTANVTVSEKKNIKKTSKSIYKSTTTHAIYETPSSKKICEHSSPSNFRIFRISMKHDQLSQENRKSLSKAIPPMVSYGHLPHINPTPGISPKPPAPGTGGLKSDSSFFNLYRDSFIQWTNWNNRIKQCVKQNRTTYKKTITSKIFNIKIFENQNPPNHRKVHCNTVAVWKVWMKYWWSAMKWTAVAEQCLSQYRFKEAVVFSLGPRPCPCTRHSTHWMR